ncbi:Trans-acting factor C [Dissostichus eleginoides]|uniref:Trans-acting factor C n=1 Tax=Dissostichus eleginoides TaxID=100907 RepID=A0AAD9F9I0_DISEL|nr:Trans-acting factor C [Dissostichus eleginoides]
MDASQHLGMRPSTLGLDLLSNDTSFGVDKCQVWTEYAGLNAEEMGLPPHFFSASSPGDTDNQPAHDVREQHPIPEADMSPC